MKEVYEKRRDYVYDRFTNMGISVNKPNGAFYLFPKISKPGMSSLELGVDLVRKGKVALVPGGSFSEYGEQYMRLSYAYDFTTLEKGLNRLEEYFHRHGKG